MEWHEHAGHIPYSTMADNVEAGAWAMRDGGFNVPLLRELSRRKSCILCALTQWPQVTHEGSGIPLTINPKDIGKYVVADYVGPYTPHSHGRSGFYALACPH